MPTGSGSRFTPRRADRAPGHAGTTRVPRIRENGGMTMRTDCRHYESRTYASGEAVRKCALDLAPEAPWRCPVDCPRFERRMIDAGWTYGSMAKPMAPPPPEPDVPMTADVAALLDEAEDIVNAAGADLLDEHHRKGSRKKLFRKRKKR